MTGQVNNVVRKLRTAKKITQKDLAKDLGVSRQTVIAIEKGNYAPSILLALKMARFFKKKVEAVFSYQGS